MVWIAQIGSEHTKRGFSLVSVWFALFSGGQNRLGYGWKGSEVVGIGLGRVKAVRDGLLQSRYCQV